MPHKGLAGISPFDYLIRGHRQRLDIVAPVSGLEGWMGTPQEEEDLPAVLGCWEGLRQVVDWCGETSAVQRAIDSARVLETPRFAVGDWVLKFVAQRANSLEPMYPRAVLCDSGPGE